MNIINLLDRVSKLNVAFKSLFGTASLWKTLMLKAIEIREARLLNVPWPHLSLSEFMSQNACARTVFFELRISSTSLVRSESLRYVLSSVGCLKFSLWIAFPAMPDVKGGTNDSHPRRGPPRHKTELPISGTRSDRIREIFRFISKF